MTDQKQEIVNLIRSHRGQVALEDAQRVVSYAELGELIDRRVRQLLELGAAGGLVALERAKSVEFIVDYLSILAVGAAVIPLDPRTPPERRETFLALTRPGFLLGEDKAVALGTGDAGRVPADAAFIYFTSGSTGVPKPVLGSARALRSFVDWFAPAFGVGPGDRFAFSAGLSFEASLRDIFPPLCSGATLVLPADEAAASPEEAVKWLAHHDISVVTVVPSVARAWLRAGGPPCPEVRLAVFLGEPLTNDLLAQWHTVFPHTAVRVNSYGTTESGQATIYRRIGPRESFEGRVPSGFPVPGTRYAFIEPESVLDADLVRAALQRAGDGGEIVIVSRACSHGYLGLPEENAARFADLGDGVKAYRTGDLGRVDANGELVVIGRADDEVKINGVRVHPAEVMRALRAHPSIADAFVTTARQGDGAVTAARQRDGSVTAARQGDESRLTAYVMAARPGPIDLVELRRDLLEALPPAMIPSVFVQVDGFPTLRTGKVDRVALQALAVPQVACIEPQGEVECWVAAELAGLLGSPHVYGSDDFFVLGGDSITATQLAVRVAQEFGMEFSQRDVFAGTTVAGIASIVVDKQLLAVDPRELQALLESLEGEAA